MKTILFFDRCNLTELYILLTKELQGKVNIIHVAYSDLEAKMLEEAGIHDYIHYQNRLSALVSSLKPTDKLIQEIDELIIQQSEGQFSLNASIQNDRGYSLLNYQEALLLSCCHYMLWQEIYRMQHVDIMYHEFASLFMTQIAAIICKNQGGEYIYQTQLLGDKIGYYYLNIDGENFGCKELKYHYEYFKEHPNEIDIERCKTFIDKFKSEYNIAFSNIIKPTSNKWSLAYKSLKEKMIGFLYRNKYDKLKNNIDYWILKNHRNSEMLHNIRQYKTKKIQFTQPVPGEKYFYYSIHLEPESIVLYLGGGLYVNQVKLIENIASSLPAGYYLYVKDHPHVYAYRKAEDYERLMKIPNIRLLNRLIPGKSIIKNAIGVFSIVGTAGFEGLVLGKQVYCFGHNYYTISSRVNYVNNIRDLRPLVYNNMTKSYNDDMELYTFIYSYLLSLHKGFVTYFGRERLIKSGINELENAKTISIDILEKVNANNVDKKRDNLYTPTN